MLAALLLLSALQAEPPAATPEPIDRLQWITQADYPIEALARGESGTVRYRLRVDAQGRPWDCEILESAGETLDSTTCALMIARARFAPARDAEGQAVEGSYTSSIVWRTHDGQADGMPFGAVELVDVLEVLPDGEIACTLIANGGPPHRLLEEQCRQRAQTMLAPLRAFGPGAAMTLIVRIEPEGQAAPHAEGDWGERLAEAQGRFVVGPDGRLAQCQEAIEAAYAFEGAPALRACAYVQSGTGFVADADVPERRGRVSVAFHLRTAPGALRRLPRPERPLRELFAEHDYPLEAHRRGEEGTVQFRLEIDASGRVTDCIVTQSSGSASLDAQTCRIMRQRARFSPGLDDRDRPIASQVTNQATWRLEGDEGRLRFAAELTIIALTAGPRGGCEIGGTGESPGLRPALDEAEMGLCSILMELGFLLRREAPAGARVVLIDQVTPLGETAAPLPAFSGDRIWEVEAEIDIAPDGHVAACRTIARDITDPRVEEIADICAQRAHFPLYETVPPGSPMRRARVRSRLVIDTRTHA